MNGREGDEAVVPGEVRALLEERNKVRQWLGKLEELEEEATPAVYAKVREDYRGRLADVNARLTAHREEIEDSVREHRERAAGLEERRGAEAAELEESEIRFRVGEYPEEQWMRRREEREGAIADLDGRLEQTRGSLGRLEEILDEIAAAGGEVDGSPDGPSSNRFEEGRGGGRSRLAAGGAWPAAEPAADERGADDEGSPLDAERAVAAAPPQEAAAAPPEDAAAAPPDDGEAGADEDFLDELEFLESLSLDQADRFDAVSLALEEEEGKGGEGSGG